MKILYICHNLATFILSEAIQISRQGHDVFIMGENNSRLYEVINEPMLVKYGLDKNFIGFSLASSRWQKYPRFLVCLLYDIVLYPKYTSKAWFYLMTRYLHPGHGIVDYLDVRNFFGTGIQLIHSPFSVPLIIDKVFLLSKILNVPYTLSFKAHDIWQGNNLTATKEKVEKLRNASKIFTIATCNKLYLQNQLGTDKDIEVIHDAVDVEFFRSTNGERSPNSIVSVSRLSPEKGLIYLIRACHILNQRQIDYHCTIVGSGPEMPKYKALIDELEIPNIYFTGILSYDQVKKQLDAHAIFVLPSIIDSDGLGDVLPNGVKEAMSMEIPVITSSIRGIEELVVDGVNGVLVPQASAEGIADAIEMMIRRPDVARNMGKEGRKKIENDFNLKTEVRKIERIFKEAVPPKNNQEIPFLQKIRRDIRFLKLLRWKKPIVQGIIESENFEFFNFSPPGHFYSSIPDINEIQQHADRIFDRSPQELPGIQLNAESQIQLVKSLSGFYGEMPFQDEKSADYRYFLDNPFFAYGDGIILYSFLRHFQPKRIVEIGSGFSSAAMLDVNDAFMDHRIKFTFIDPFPDRLLGLISPEDKAMVCIEVKPVQDVELDVFTSLEANDILFVDSSHVAKIDSDVVHILFNILPRLKKGVIVHFHDIPWPFEYPRRWLEEGRAWNEAYFLRAFLQNNENFEILFFNSFMAFHHADLFSQAMPKVVKRTSWKYVVENSSLWIRKVN